MDEPALQPLRGEARAVFQWRYDQAREAGLTLREAAMFAEHGQDIGLLRKLVKAGCPPSRIADIVT